MRVETRHLKRARVYVCSMCVCMCVRARVCVCVCVTMHKLNAQAPHQHHASVGSCSTQR